MRTKVFQGWAILFSASACWGCATGSLGSNGQGDGGSGGAGGAGGAEITLPLEPSCDAHRAAMPEIVQISLGQNATFALDSEGNVWSWGALSPGQNYGPTPARMDSLSNVTQIAAGFHHACALRADGTLRCWGENEFGQLGDGTFSDISTPIDYGTVEVLGLDKVVQVSCGQFHTCAVREDGTVWCWGQRASFRNWHTQGPFEQVTPYQIPGISDTVVVGAGGGYTTCALSATDQLTCWGSSLLDETYWGSGYEGELTPTYYVMPTLGPVKQLSTGAGACVLLEDRTIQCFGEGQPSPAGLWENVAEFGMGNDGRLWCVSLRGDASLHGGETRCLSVAPYNFDPPMDPAKPLPGVGAVELLAVGREHACGIDKGCMKCWGSNQWGQIGIGTIGTKEDARRPVPVHWAAP